MINAKNQFEMYEEVWPMPGKVPVTIIDEATDANGERYYTVACETEYYYQQQKNPTDGFGWWCTTYDCSPEELMRKAEDQGNDKDRD